VFSYQPLLINKLLAGITVTNKPCNSDSAISSYVLHWSLFCVTIQQTLLIL